MSKNRFRFFQILMLLAFLVVIGRLFYWQVYSAERLKALAQLQHETVSRTPAVRGEILSADGFPLAANRPAYLAYLYTPNLKLTSGELTETLTPTLLSFKPIGKDYEATGSAEAEIKDYLTGQLDSGTSWFRLAKDITSEQKEQLERFNIPGIGFEEGSLRYYPEASMAAHILGFVGSDAAGNPQGYFGLEGYYNLELSGTGGLVKQEKDAMGRPIIIGDYSVVENRDGRSLKTHIRRDIQLMVERLLKRGISRYGAISGEVLIMDPKTGAVLAMASLPTYDPSDFRNYNQESYQNPAIFESYEPGSTFKTIVMAAALNEGKITPETVCESACAGPVKIGSYQIRTWNNEYNPGLTMNQVLERSDNTGMVFVANRLGKDTFVQYLKDFGLGAKTGIDLEGEGSPPLRQRWGDIDLATGSFGQGLALTSLQMLTAVSSLANGGMRMQPQVVDEVITRDGILKIEPKELKQVISAEAAKTVTEMMVKSAKNGEARWNIPEGYTIAGKTGTAQIPIAGHYDAEKTMASFVGFAPAKNPQFTMLVKLRETSSSPWASETAAPLWFEIAKELFYLLKIPAENTE